jgi:hypothetical protein
MILEGDEIPYPDLTTDFFKDTASQKIIPFLGAGVSISAKSAATALAAAAPAPDRRVVEALAGLARSGGDYPDADGARPTLDDATKLYVEFALEMAFVIQRMRDAGAAADEASVLDRLKDDKYPPSASELVAWLSQSVSYGSFEDVLTRVAKRLQRDVDEPSRKSLLNLVRAIAGLAGVSPAPLSSLSAYFEALRPRRTLLDRLTEILQNKTVPTPTHALIARAARWHLSPRVRKDGRPLPAGTGHYLIMTTNYDNLMEHALGVPWVVLTMSNRDFLVRARFGNMPDALKTAFQAANPPRTARSFTLEQPAPGSVPPSTDPSEQYRLAIIYKIHGSIQDWCVEGAGEASQHDTIVISDNDYVVNISRFSHNDGVIPASVSAILGDETRPYFLFMGYSLSDWNIRGMLRAIRTKRAGEGNEGEDYGDYTIVRAFGKLEEAFFIQNKIRIIHADLNAFSTTVGARVDRQYGAA